MLYFLAARRRAGGFSIARNYRVNQQIRVPEIRLVDDQGDQLGLMPVPEALALAKERHLDLVEVAAAASPPVCLLMDYGRFKYEATRKEREARKARRGKPTNELREVRFKIRIGEHDRAFKTRLVKRLLDQGAKVKVSIMFRGREITHPEVGMVLLKSVADDLIDDAMLEKAPGFEGRWLTMVLAPNPESKTTTPTTEAEPEEEPERELDRAKA